MSRKVEDYIGKKIHHLTILEDRGLRKTARFVLVQCDCEAKTVKEVYFASLFATIPTKSCGCVKLKNLLKRKDRHGLSQSKEYNSWAKMKARCYDVRNNRFSSHGERGITVCEEWKDSFDQFYADMGPMPKEAARYSIERIDNNKDYCKDNCKWATYKEQSNNRRNNHIIAFNGVSRTLAQWADELGMGRSTIGQRLYCGWSIEKALTTPVTGGSRSLTGGKRFSKVSKA